MDYESDDSFVVADGESEVMQDDSEDGFEPLREAGKPRDRPKRQLGPPITIDEKLEELNSIHRAVVEDFLIHAKKKCKEVSLEGPRTVLLFGLIMVDSHPKWSSRTTLHRRCSERNGYQFPCR